MVSSQTRAALRAARSQILARWAESQLDPDRLRRFAVAGVEDREVVAGAFLPPLLDLLLQYLRTGEPRYRALYLDERLRYAPHQADPAVRRDFFGEVLERDEQALLAAVRGHNGAADELGRALTDLHEPLRSEPGADMVRLAAVGDCLLNEVRVFLPHRAAEYGIPLDVRCFYFSASMGRGLDAEATLRSLEATQPHLISFSFLTYEGLPPYLALLREADRLPPQDIDERCRALIGVIRQFLDSLRERMETPFLLHNASGLPLTRARKYLPLLSPLSAGRARVIERLNAELAELAAALPNTTLIDERTVASRHGYRRCAGPVVSRRVSNGAFFHTTRFGEFLAEPYLDVVRAYRDLSKAKVLCVDFDYTLWDGVMADGPVRHHAERQHLLRRVKDAGILLVAVSKNDPANLRWDEIGLSPDDFVQMKVSWQPKAESIAQSAQELDLGLDAFALVDDNPAERELVRLQLPAVRLLDAGDPYAWRALELLLAFPNTRTTAEARSRTELYRAQAQRRDSQSQAGDFGSLMQSLRLVARFGRARPRDVDRISELVQRTNQFNTTTIRYPRPDLERMLRDPAYGVYVAELDDKFGKLGLVLVAIVARDGEVATFESVVMSCRAMGFGLERVALARVLAAEGAARRFVGRALPTDRNSPALGLFDESGFKRSGDTEWTLDATDPRPTPPTWIALMERPE